MIATIKNVSSVCDEVREFIAGRHVVTVTLITIFSAIICFTLNAVLISYLVKFRRLHLSAMNLAINASLGTMLASLGFSAVAIVDSIASGDCPYVVNSMRRKAEKGSLADTALYSVYIAHVLLSANRYIATRSACKKFESLKRDLSPHVTGLRLHSRFGWRPNALFTTLLIWFISLGIHANVWLYWSYGEERSGDNATLGQSSIFCISSELFTFQLLLYVGVALAVIVPFSKALNTCIQKLKIYYLNHVPRNSTKIAIMQSIQITEVFYPGSLCVGSLLLVQQLLLLGLRLSLDQEVSSMRRYLYYYHSATICTLLTLLCSTTATLSSIGKLRKSPGFAFLEAQNHAVLSFSRRATVVPSAVAPPTPLFVEAAVSVHEPSEGLPGKHNVDRTNLEVPAYNKLETVKTPPESLAHSSRLPRTLPPIREFRSEESKKRRKKASRSPTNLE